MRLLLDGELGQRRIGIAVIKPHGIRIARVAVQRIAHVFVHAPERPGQGDFCVFRCFDIRDQHIPCAVRAAVRELVCRDPAVRLQSALRRDCALDDMIGLIHLIVAGDRDEMPRHIQHGNAAVFQMLDEFLVPHRAELLRAERKAVFRAPLFLNMLVEDIAVGAACAGTQRADIDRPCRQLDDIDLAAVERIHRIAEREDAARRRIQRIAGAGVFRECDFLPLLIPLIIQSAVRRGSRERGCRYARHDRCGTAEQHCREEQAA